MPRHATRTTFKKGYIQSQETKDKRNATLQKKREEGWRSLKPGYIFSEETKQKRAKTKRENSIGNVTYYTRNNVTYKSIMTIDGYKAEHRYVMEQHLGRKLLSAEHIHHIDGNGCNNNISNLLIVTNSEHYAIHHQKISWSKKYDCCQECKTTERKHMAKGLCTACCQRLSYIKKGK